MEKELEAANTIATTDASGGFHSTKEAVYNFLGNLFSWLSTHQGLALIIILIVLGIIIWLILRFRRYGKQHEKKVASQNIEMGKKDALIEEQKTKLEALQKKMSDQQGVVSEALLKTIMSLTGYDIDQLQLFFKSLTEISGNPLQLADNQSNTMAPVTSLEEESDGSLAENDANEKIDPESGPEEVVNANKSERE